MNAPVDNRHVANGIGPAAVTATPLATLADLIGAVEGFARFERAKRTHLQGRLLRLAELLGNTPAAFRSTWVKSAGG